MCFFAGMCFPDRSVWAVRFYSPSTGKADATRSRGGLRISVVAGGAFKEHTAGIPQMRLVLMFAIVFIIVGAFVVLVLILSLLIGNLPCASVERHRSSHARTLAQLLVILRIIIRDEGVVKTVFGMLTLEASR